MWWLLACTARIPPEGEGPGWRLQHLDVGQGLSGLTVDDQGRLWSVSERPAALVRLEDGHEVPLELDAEPESIAWSPEGFWLGTERAEPRTQDAVYLVSEEGAVLRTLTVPHAPITPLPNHGLEGACLRGSQLLLAGEDPRVHEGQRQAPIHTPGEEPRWLRLRSDTGKVSALACTDTHLYAIERHYEVLHLLRAPHDDLGASEVLEVPDAARGSKVNYEGLALQGDRAWLLSDNQGASVDGPTLLLSLELPRP